MRKAKKRTRVLLLTPPLLQTSCPYPATMHLTGYLRSRGYDVHQRDLSIAVALDVLRRYGDETTDELIELLQGPAPEEAKRAASEAIDELAIRIRDEIDPDFGFSRYAERLCASIADFGEVERRVRRRGVMDVPLARHLDAAMAETNPDIVGVTCPFPGTLIGAFKIARRIRRRHPQVKLVLGGGYANTELREMDDPRVAKYFDLVMLDEGYAPWERLLGNEKASPDRVPAFVAPSYDGIDMSRYMDVVETDNPVANLWNSGKWIRLVMARGCYWHKCAFCDVVLPYIGEFRMPEAVAVVDCMEEFAGRSARRVRSARRADPTFVRFHFVDEAMPPGLIRGVCEEIIRRGLECEWWGNVRFDAAFTPELARLMAKAGCVAVTGGLECADDRLLALMNKGITLKSATKALKAFRRAGIAVHAYLMYGFPTETEREARGALDFVRGLFADGLVQSAFWHRFALTVHSPIARDPERFGIRIVDDPPRKGRVFARNELAYEEPGAPEWDRIGKALALALYNYQQGRGLDKSADWWFRKRFVI